MLNGIFKRLGGGSHGWNPYKGGLKIFQFAFGLAKSIDLKRSYINIKARDLIDQTFQWHHFPYFKAILVHFNFRKFAKMKRFSGRSFPPFQ